MLLFTYECNQFYHKLNGDILQMNNLWNFLDDIDD